MPSTVSVMSVITVYSVLRQLNSSHCWLQVMETTFWPPTHHLHITQERSWGATSLAFTSRSTPPGWAPSPSSLNPSPEWVDVSRMLAGTSLTVSWVFSCVCLCVALRWKLLFRLRTRDSGKKLLTSKGCPAIIPYTFLHITEPPHLPVLPHSRTQSTQRSVNPAEVII